MKPHTQLGSAIPYPKQPDACQCSNKATGKTNSKTQEAMLCKGVSKKFQGHRFQVPCLKKLGAYLLPPRKGSTNLKLTDGFYKIFSQQETVVFQPFVFQGIS